MKILYNLAQEEHFFSINIPAVESGANFLLHTNIFFKIVNLIMTPKNQPNQTPT